MSLNCNLDLMCGSNDGLGDFIFLLPFWGNNLNAYYKDYVPATATFKRASAANQVDDLGLTPVAIDVPKLNHGITLEGATTNKVTCAKSNPQDLTNITKSGGAAAVLSVVNDATELAAAGLSAYGPNVYKLDNSAGGTWVYAIASGTVGNLNPHSSSAYVRGSGLCQARFEGDSGVPSSNTPLVYSRIKTENRTPNGTGNRFVAGAGPNSVIYFLLPQLEEGPVCTSPISGGTGTITRATEGGDAASPSNGLSIPLSQAMVDSLVGEAHNFSDSSWIATGASSPAGLMPTASNGNRTLSSPGGTFDSVPVNRGPSANVIAPVLGVTKYEAVIVVSGRTKGFVRFRCGNSLGNLDSGNLSANGTYTFRGAFSGDAAIRCAMTSSFDGSITIVSFCRVLENGQVNRGEGTICQWVDLPWPSSVVPANTNIPIIGFATNSDRLYIRKGGDGSYWGIESRDGVYAVACGLPVNSTSIRYCLISQWSAALGKMRVGIYNPATGALTWGRPTLDGADPYRGFFPIFGTGDQQRLRFYYGGSQFPIHFYSTAWYNRVLTDNEIMNIVLVMPS